MQVVVPNDLRDMDLTLTSARVKLKRVYVTPQPLPPPAAGASTAEAGAKKPRAKRAGAAAAASGVELPPVSLKVSAAGVVDNLGGKRLEVTVSRLPRGGRGRLGAHGAAGGVCWRPLWVVPSGSGGTTDVMNAKVSSCARGHSL